MQPHPEPPHRPRQGVVGQDEDINIHLLAATLLLHPSEAAAEVNSGYAFLETITNRCINREVKIGKCFAIDHILLNANQRPRRAVSRHQKQRSSVNVLPVAWHSNVHY